MTTSFGGGVTLASERDLRWAEVSRRLRRRGTGIAARVCRVLAREVSASVLLLLGALAVSWLALLNFTSTGPDSRQARTCSEVWLRSLHCADARGGPAPDGVATAR